MSRVMAVYRNGVFEPKEPRMREEGQTVYVDDECGEVDDIPLTPEELEEWGRDIADLDRYRLSDEEYEAEKAERRRQ